MFLINKINFPKILTKVARFEGVTWIVTQHSRSGALRDNPSHDFAGDVFRIVSDHPRRPVGSKSGRNEVDRAKSKWRKLNTFVASIFARFTSFPFSPDWLPLGLRGWLQIN